MKEALLDKVRRWARGQAKKLFYHKYSCCGRWWKSCKGCENGE